VDYVAYDGLYAAPAPIAARPSPKPPCIDGLFERPAIEIHYLASGVHVVAGVSRATEGGAEHGFRNRIVHALQRRFLPPKEDDCVCSAVLRQKLHLIAIALSVSEALRKKISDEVSRFAISVLEVGRPVKLHEELSSISETGGSMIRQPSGLQGISNFTPHLTHKPQTDVA